MIESLKQKISIRSKRRLHGLLFGSSVSKVLKTIEAERGALPSRTRKQCDDYAAEVLGYRPYANWLYVYSLITGEFREGWMPDDYYVDFVVPKRNGAHGQTSDLNLLQSRLFDGETFPDLAYKVNTLFLDRDMNTVNPDQLADMLFATTDAVVFKLDKSMQGKGVRTLDRHAFEALDLRQLPDGVFQRRVIQHPFFDQFHAASAATLRLTTATGDDGVPTLRSAYMRLGQGSETHVLAATVLRVLVDMETGELDGRGFLVDWREIATHPDSGAKFGGQKIPEFSACVARAIEMHRQVPYVRCIGWGVTVDDQGNVAFFEWNGGHNDIKFSEAIHGPCFADLGWETLWRKTAR